VFIKSSEWPSGRDSVYRSNLYGPQMSHGLTVIQRYEPTVISEIANVLNVSRVKCLFINTQF